MRKVYLLYLIILLSFTQSSAREVTDMVENIYWLGHDSFKIKYEGKIIYIDPFRLKENEEKGDIILLTHPHFDHTSEEDIKKIAKNDTVIVGIKESLDKLSGNKRTIKVGNTIEFDNIKITAVPAYNVNKKFHPKSNGWVGYVLELGDIKIYHAGDTDRIPEMKDLKVNIALIPVSGVYVMSWEEAVQAVLDIKPDIVIPMHYGSIVGSQEDAMNFKKALEGKVKVVIKNKN